MFKPPLEKFESAALAKRLDKHEYRFSAIRNESDTKSMYKGKVRKLSGVRKGIPDFCIILKNRSLCFIELKRQRPPRRRLKSGKMSKQGAGPSSVSKEQKEWIEDLNSIPSIHASICYGYADATDYIIGIEAM